MAKDILRDSSYEKAHRPHWNDRHASKELAGRAIALHYPKLVGAVVDEADLTRPEYLSSETSNVDPQRGTAVGSVATSHVDDFQQWEQELATPAEAFAAPPSPSQGQTGTAADYELVG